MPTKKYVPRKKTNYRRRRRYTRRSLRANVLVSKTSPLPDRFFTKMKYSGLHGLTYTGLGVPAVYQYRCQSIFDPDISGVGHQPLSHDQFALLYNRYRVYGVKWTCTFVNQDTAQQFDIFALVRPNPNAPTVTETILESPFVYKGILGVESGQGVKTFRGYVSNAKILGISKAQHRMDDLNQAFFGVNPVSQGPVITFGVTNLNVAAAGTVNIRVDLEYYVECFDRKIFTQS